MDMQQNYENLRSGNRKSAETKKTIQQRIIATQISSWIQRTIWISGSFHNGTHWFHKVQSTKIKFRARSVDLFANNWN